MTSRPSGGTPHKPGCRPFRWLPLSLALLCTVAVYAQAVFFEFVYDDFGQIVHNPQIQSWSRALWYFKAHVWAQASRNALYYRPAYMLWLAANYKLFSYHASYWHLAVIGLHLICCVLVFFLALRLTEDKSVAAVTALLFGLHPAHVESVAWVSGATDPLMVAMLLGSVLCYIRYRDRGNMTRGWKAASLFLACLAVLTKETALIIPALIFSHQWIFSETGTSWKMRFRASFSAATPYLVVSFLFLVMRALAMKSLTPQHTKVGLRSVLLAWPQLLTFYGAHGLFPLRLSVFYNLLTVPHPGWWNLVLPVVLVLAGVAALCYLGRKSPLWFFLSAWLAITMLPVLNVTFWDNAENVHDRYLYLPSVAICAMLASGLSWLKQRHFIGAAVVTVAIVAGYASVTTLELRYWQNDYILGLRGMMVSPGHPIAPQVVGNALIREHRIGEAVPYLLDALHTDPNDVGTLCNLAFCYSEMSLLLAEETVNKAIAIDPAEPRAHLLLGIVRFKQRRLAEAEAEIRRGIDLRPMSTGVIQFHYNLGNVLYDKGDVQGAIREYRLELLNDPAGDPAADAARTRIDQLEGRLQQQSQQQFQE